ncbi:hypothetical protein XBI1_1420063 [Xenorhabdus bovienii str. Intermedium]|uniref:Uncharacterized protein n=1 Tax=Xenorhabdus bovienii str. Intermedium TaxID=1379677 RepID=A0A077QE08_XENBV|nr:hypothetical protein XBI1_1420063 [Xenorhabdus bovienii str. Intermedium]
MLIQNWRLAMSRFMIEFTEKKQLTLSFTDSF